MFNKSCVLSIQSGGRNQHLRLMYCKEKKQSNDSEDIEHMIQIDDVYYIKYHIDIDANPDQKENAEENDKKLESSSSSLPNILIFQIIPNVENKLVMYPNQYKPEDSTFNKKYIIVEFQSSDKLIRLLDLLKKIEEFKKLVEDGGLTVEERRHFISLLSTDGNSPAGRNTRSSARKSYLKSVKSDQVLLSFPFEATYDELDHAASGLAEANCKFSNGHDCAHLIKSSENFDGTQTFNNVWKHSHIIRGEDYNRLQPEEYLNDSLIDLWMTWYVTCEIFLCVHSSFRLLSVFFMEQDITQRRSII